MKRQTRRLKETGIESLTLAVELFNRPSPVARPQGVLLNLQHSFEMLFKAVIYEKKGSIRPANSGKAYSFSECLGMVRGLGHLDEVDAIVAGTIDAHRDAIQHHGAAISEDRLYVDAASGVRLFELLLERSIGETLAESPEFANRMFPISLKPPREMHVLNGNDVDAIRELLAPGKHKHAEARALLHTLVVAEQVAQDPMAEVEHPSDAQLETLAKKLQEDSGWTSFLPGLAKLSLDQQGEGATYSLKIAKSGDLPEVKLVKEGDPGADDAVSILKYNELDRFPFESKQLHGAADVNQYEGRALVHLLRIKNDSSCFKVFKMGKLEHHCYSHEALRRIRDAKEAGRLPEAKLAYGEYLRARR